MNGDLSYNTNSLQTYNPTTHTGINTNVINHTDSPDQDAALYTVANANDSNVPDSNYQSRKVSIAGTIHGSSQADLDSRIDTFRGYFAQRNKNLDIAYGSGTRRYVVMKINTFSLSRSNKSLYASFTIEFLCKPFGFDTSTTSLLSHTGFTSATVTDTPTVGGTAPYQLPVYTITINSLTGSGDYVQISNDNNGQEILLYGLGLTAGDVIVVDAENRSVTVNGDEVDYYGTFLELEPGASSLTYTDGFTTRNVDIAASYTKRYF